MWGGWTGQTGRQSHVLYCTLSFAVRFNYNATWFNSIPIRLPPTPSRIDKFFSFRLNYYARSAPTAWPCRGDDGQIKIPFPIWKVCRVPVPPPYNNVQSDQSRPFNSPCTLIRINHFIYYHQRIYLRYDALNDDFLNVPRIEELNYHHH